MYQNKTFLAVIPVRGGSKGLPRKNILPFMGKPLMLHSLAEAKKSKYLDRIVFSTEDAEIKKIAQEAGGEVIDRPDELAQDHCSTESALLQVINYVKGKEGKAYDYIVTLQVTSPLRSVETIDQGIEMISSGEFDSLFSCSRIFKTLGTKVGDEFKPLIPFAELPRRRQDRKPFYGSNGVLYITKTGSLIKEELCTAGRIAILETPEEESADIDNQLDFKIAELLFKHRQETYEKS